MSGGEECDQGALNGQPSSCCTATCTAVAANTTCDDGDDCTQNDACDGTGICAGTLLPETSPPIIKAIDVEDTPAVLDGSTLISVEGSVDNTVTAFVFDPALCRNPSAAPPTVHWVISTPNTIGYTARGIRGYQSSILEVDADSIPNFAPQSILFQFTVTSSVPNPSGTFFSTTKAFRAVYRNSALTIGMSTTCQTMQQTGSGCDIEAALAVTPGTPT